MENLPTTSETAELSWAGLAAAACVLACVPATIAGLLQLF
jgi:hypothetical protein